MRVLTGNVQALSDAFVVLGRYRQLTFEMARREIGERYSGQVLGVFWAIGHPLFLMGLYVFVFAFVFRTNIGGTYELPLDYTTYILAGLIPWMSFQESMNKSCVAITGNAALVKQVVFPLEVLPVKGVIASLLSQMVSTAILLTYVLLTQGRIHLTYVLLPLLILLQVIAMIGVAFALSAVGVFFRDLKDLVQIFGLAGMYLVPIFYLPQWVPGLFKPVLYLNPFSYLTWCYQDVLYFGRLEHPWAWTVTTAGSLGIFVLGYRLFRRLKPTFGNLL